MAERRLPLSVTDDDGIERRGDLVVTGAWRADLQPTADAEFAIVLLQEPLAPNDPAPSAGNVAVCTPASPVRLPAAVAESTVAYANDRTAPIRLSRDALESYARGKLLTPAGVSITPAEVFSNSGAGPRLDLLARALLSAGRRAERYWDA
ncbi:MAG: hypothetical protein U1B78_06810, partial [Dehalococcoidia bacterium]|nr:hypothetical protein [Dehalococcoidia bacterium]